MTEDVFRLPLSNYDDLTHIIVGYSRFDGVMSPADVGRAIRMHKTTVSSNNAFLVSTGLVTSGQMKRMTDLGRDLARALDSQVAEEISRTWRLVVRGVAFFGDVLAALQSYEGMNAAALQVHIVHSAGYNKGPRAMSGAAAVTDIMKAATLIRKRDDKYVVAEADAGRYLNIPPIEITVPSGLHTSLLGPEDATPSSAAHSRAIEGPEVRVQLNIQCTVADLDLIADKLTPLIAQMSKLSRSRA